MLPVGCFHHEMLYCRWRNSVDKELVLEPLKPSSSPWAVKVVGFVRIFLLQIRSNHSYVYTYKALVCLQANYGYVWIFFNIRFLIEYLYLVIIRIQCYDTVIIVSKNMIYIQNSDMGHWLCGMPKKAREYLS